MNSSRDGYDRATLERYAARFRAAAPALVAAVVRLTMPSARPPWHATGVEMSAGQQASWFAGGETVLSGLTCIRLPARFQPWALPLRLDCSGRSRRQPVNCLLRGARLHPAWSHRPAPTPSKCSASPSRH